MSEYHSFTSARLTEPDLPSLLSQLRVQDATAGIQHNLGTPNYVIKKTTTWTAPQITFAQNAIDTAPAVSAQLTAQSQVDALPIEFRALVLALIDQINILRAALPVPLTAITPAQALAAIRAKAGTL